MQAASCLLACLHTTELDWDISDKHGKTWDPVVTVATVRYESRSCPHLRDIVTEPLSHQHYVYHLTQASRLIYIRPSSVVVESFFCHPAWLSDNPFFISTYFFRHWLIGFHSFNPDLSFKRPERHEKCTGIFPDAIDLVGPVAWLPMTGLNPCLRFHTFLLPCSTVPTANHVYVSYHG